MGQVPTSGAPVYRGGGCRPALTAPRPGGAGEGTGGSDENRGSLCEAAGGVEAAFDRFGGRLFRARSNIFPSGAVALTRKVPSPGI